MILRYFKNILIAIDQLLNTIFGGFPDETISSRCGKLLGKNRIADYICKELNKAESNHCVKSIEPDEGNK